MTITSYKLKNGAIVICSDEKPKGSDLCLYNMEEILRFDRDEFFDPFLCKKVILSISGYAVYYFSLENILTYKNVIVDISCSEVAFNYPENNILIGIEPTEYVFKSDEIESEDGLWRFPIYSEGCSVVLTLKDV